MKFTGVLPALITPLKGDETVNTEALAKLIEDLLAKGADGFYVGGATGEGLALQLKQRFVLAEQAMAAVKNRKPCIIQVASTDFNAALELARHAEAIGAAAISATPPLFFQYSPEDVYNYYKALAEAVHIPLMIYYNPAAGFNMNADFAARMFEVDNITAIKWTSSNYFEMMKVKELTKGEMNVLNGPDEMLLMGLTAGADGGIGTTYNFMFDIIKSIYDHFQAGDLQAAQEAQQKANRIISVLQKYPIIPATKAVMEAMGYEAGNATFPMRRFTATEKAEMLNAFRDAGLQL